VLDEFAQAGIKRVLRHAMAPQHWYRPKKDARIPGDDPQFVAHIRDGYRCVFTITQTEGTIFRHLTISVPSEDKYPNIVAAFLIAQEFGFVGWDGKTIDVLPPGWMGDVNKVDHCITLVQPYEVAEKTA
jgi:hypothetical protein